MLGAYVAEQYHLGKRVFKRPTPIVLALIPPFIAAFLFKPTVPLCPAIAAILSAIALEKCLWFELRPNVLSRFLISLGVCSYSLYLWHQPMLPMIYTYLGVHRVHGPAAQYLLLVALSIAILFPYSYGLYLAVELPAQRAGKRFALKPRKSTTSGFPPV
jgi:peptidoglycan/LPS O-acetylase OafA/YrhL